jgi:uncharacterized protein (TIGR03083 family)
MAVMTVNLKPVLRSVEEVPALQHADAPALAQVEFERVLSVLESLSEDDWEQPTYCTGWNVREMVAHLAGAVAGFATWGEFARQYVRNSYVRTESAKVDGVNRRQVEDRADRSPAALIQEFREAGPKAIRVRHKLPYPLRKAPVLRGEPVRDTSLQYLLDVIYPRDWWMHRYDICAATGKEMLVTAAHDGRLVELIILDVAYVLGQRGLGDRSFVLDLTGAAGGSYRFGTDLQPDTTISMDVFDFALVSSGRISAEEALSRTAVDGNRELGGWFTANCEVLY